MKCPYCNEEIEIGLLEDGRRLCIHDIIFQKWRVIYGKG